MAKADSEFAALGLARQEVAGEHWRAVAEPDRGERSGTGYPDQAAPMAGDDQGRRFDDLFNLVCDPAFLVVAWHRVRHNKGARTAGVDGASAYDIQHRGVGAFLNDLRVDLKARTFQPLPVRERSIPKPGTHRRRRLGIPTVSA